MPFCGLFLVVLVGEVFVDIDERLDFINCADIRLIQKIDGTAYAIDTILLADFVILEGFAGRVMDLGSGNGILSFLIKFRKPEIQITGLELSEEFIRLSNRNLDLNEKISGIIFENGDVRDVPAKFLPDSFEMVVSNPPYYPLGTGKLPTSPGKAMARHEVAGTLNDFIEAAAYLLPYGSKLNMVIQSNRFFEASKMLKAANLGLRRLQFVKPKEDEPSHLALFEAERFYNGPHQPLPDLVIRKSNGDFSEPLEALFRLGLKRKR